MIKLKYTVVLTSILLCIGCNEPNKQIADTPVETNDIISIQNKGLLPLVARLSKVQALSTPLPMVLLILQIKVPKGRPCMVTTHLYFIKFLQNRVSFR